MIWFACVIRTDYGNDSDRFTPVGHHKEGDIIFYSISAAGLACATIGQEQHVMQSSRDALPIAVKAVWRVIIAVK